MVIGIVTKKEATIKAQVDKRLQVTSWGGLALADQLARRTRLWPKVAETLPERVKGQGYSTQAVVSSLVYGLLQGGRGFRAAELLRNDRVARRMLGLNAGIPEEATVYRAMCDLADLPYRAEAETYKPVTTEPELIVGATSHRRGERLVGEPEAASEENMAAHERLLRQQATQLLPGISREATHIGPWLVAFGDGTQLEVTGRCFDAAEVDYNRNRSLQWLALWIGPLVVASVLRGGARDEAGALAKLFAPVQQEVVATTRTAPRGVLALLDRAMGEQSILAALEHVQWRYVVGLRSNELLTRQASEQPASQWRDTGAKPKRGWKSSAVCAMNYMAERWDRSRTVIVRRFQAEEELFERFCFVVTDLEPEDVRELCEQWNCTYEEAIWRLYDHKQARENQFKTALSDLGLHHPPSGRLGCNEVFYAIACLALNLSMALSYAVVAEEHRGMRLWRMRMWYFAVAARVQRHARQVQVWAAGAMSRAMQDAWLGAFDRIAALW